MLPDAAVREMAVPSYTHPNPLIRWLFWGRLDLAVRLADPRRGERIFEFGVGSGILLPTHRVMASRIACADLDLRPARALAGRLGIAAEFVEPSDLDLWTQSAARDFDLVYALDVLEHLDDSELRVALRQLTRLLRPGGRLIVSGPTETAMYRLGRRLAGFRNEYHERDVFDVDRGVRRFCRREAWIRHPHAPLPAAFWIGRYTPLPERADD